MWSDAAPIPAGLAGGPDTHNPMGALPLMARVLVAGLGSIGRRHLRNLMRLGVDDLVLYRTRPEPVDEAPGLPVVTDLARALDMRPDLVVVSNPTAFHLDVALPAAEAGCHLFIEKPLSHTWDRVPELLEAVDRGGLVSLTGFDLRFDRGLLRVRDLLAEGRIGRVLSVQVQVGEYLPDWHPWEDYRRGVSARVESGGGVILDLIHELDYVTWLLGPVRTVACFADRVSNLEIETEDTAAMLLRFESGAIGTVHLDYLQRAPSRTSRFIGEDGVIVWDYFTRTVRWYEAGVGRWFDFAYADQDRDDRFLDEMRHLLDCLAGRARPSADAAAGARVLALALAAKESARTGRGCPAHERDGCRP
jgi:predicted dehydrogenase